MMKRWFLLAAFAITATQAAGAAEAAKAHALIVGVGQYKDERILDRPSAEADAKALFKVVSDAKYAPAAVGKAFLLTGEKASKENILARLKEIADAAGEADTVTVALFGKGLSVAGKTVFLPADADVKKPAETGILPKQVAERVKPLKSEQVLSLIDLHFKGFKDVEELLEPPLLDLVRAFYAHEDIEGNENAEPAPLGRAVIVSNGGAVSVVDDDQRGVFSRVVIEALAGKADTEGYEADGNVTVDELVAAVEKRVPDLARQYGKDKEQKEQLPYVQFAKFSHFVITHNPEPYQKAQKQQATLRSFGEKGELKPAALEQGLELLSRMPKLKGRQEIRKAFQKLADGDLTPQAFVKERGRLIDDMKLPRLKAVSFADDVIDGVSRVSLVFIKEFDRGEVVAAALQGLYRQIEAVVPEKLKGRLADAKGADRDDLRELLIDARMRLGKREDLADGKDVDITIKAALRSLKDPYTTYFDRDDLERIRSELEGNYSGIGIQIRRDLVRDGLLVVSPIKDSPAYKEGLQAGDLIRRIRLTHDKKGNRMAQPEVISTKGMKTSDAVKKILGAAGSPVTVFVEREGEKDLKEVVIVRDNVEVESVLGYQRTAADGWKFFIDRERKIGYIYLTQFAQNSSLVMEQAVARMKERGLKGLILDLRFNPGGYLSTARDICDLFISDGKIVEVRPRVGQKEGYFGRAEGSQTDFPMAVLVNGGSASGSEIVAACLKDHSRAVVIGTRSYGKGSVQKVLQFLPSASASGQAMIKLTTATFWRPSGENLNKASTDGKPEDQWGVRPSAGFKVELDIPALTKLREKLRDHEIIPPKGKERPKLAGDPQLEKALTYLRGLIKKENPKADLSRRD